MEQMISGIRYSDFSIHFSPTGTKDEVSRLSNELNEALEIFANRTRYAVLDEAEIEAWQKLISVLTHEIMNSIAPIISLSETLSSREIAGKITSEQYAQMKQAMQTIYRRSEGLLVFVENYRKLTRIPQPTLQAIHLKPMLISLQQLMASDDIRFDLSIYPEQLILHADRNMVEQVLINLIKNAHEACSDQPNPIVKVKTEKIGQEIHISVADNGRGISPDAISKIFIPFYSTKSGGSGIGLSISRQIMLKHGGKIDVQTGEWGTKMILVFSLKGNVVK